LLDNRSPLTHRILQITLLLSIFCSCINTTGSAQYIIRGTIYDSSHNYPLESVSVLSTSGRGTVTNKTGEYEIQVSEKDSIWFSYLNKPTVKFPILKINNPFNFDIALKVSVPELKEVRVRPRNYKQDSIQNREDYAKIFNYQKGLQLSPVVTNQTQFGGAVGFDLNEIINSFRFRRNRNILSFQKRLVAQEQEKFIDHRFNKGLVRRLTGANEETLDSFMLIYRPPYFFALAAEEYDFQKYIKDSFWRFKRGLPPLAILKEEEFGF
jgi:hypothetical protein